MEPVFQTMVRYAATIITSYEQLSTLAIAKDKEDHAHIEVPFDLAENLNQLGSSSRLNKKKS